MHKFNIVIIVGCGGFIGAALRYIISAKANKGIHIGIPMGTLIVNILGAVLIGFIMEMSKKLNMSAELKTFLTTGIMGGLTTFSTFSYETITLISEGKVMMGGINAGLNLFLSLIGVSLGMFLGRIIQH